MSSKLPSHLYGTYTRYKSDTQFCVLWLVEAAKRAGHDIRKDKNQDRKVGALELTNRELVYPARSVARASPRIAVSDDFIRFLRDALRDALRARRICARWFAKTDEADAEAGKGGHLHFIQVLQTIADLLLPLHAKQSSSDSITPSNQDKATSPLDDVSNSFQKLGVQDEAHKGVNEEEQNLPSSVGAGDSHDGPSLSEVMITESQIAAAEEIKFGLHCFLFDLHRIRGFVRKIWRKYQAGVCDLGVASVVSNYAIDIVVRLEEEMFKTLRIVSDYEKVFLSLVCNTVRSMNPEQWQEALGDAEDYDNVPLQAYDFIFMREYIIADQFMNAITEHNAPIMQSVGQLLAGKKAQHGREEEQVEGKTASARASSPAPKSASLPKSDASSKKPPGPQEKVYHANWAGCEKEVQVSIALPQGAPEFIKLAMWDSIDYHPTAETCNTANSIVDEVLHVVRRAYWSQKVQLSTAFAVRLLLDSFDMIGFRDMARPREDLDATAKSARMKAKLHLAYLKGLGKPELLEEDIFKEAWVSGGHTSMHRFVEAVSDQVQEGEDARTLKGAFVSQKEFRNRPLCNPIAAGLHKFFLDFNLSKAACFYVDQTNILMGFAHFYSIARLSNKLVSAWPDLDFLIEAHTAEQLFMGATPKTETDALAEGRGPQRVSVHYRRDLWTTFCPLSKIAVARSDYRGALEKDTNLEDIELAILEMDRRGNGNSLKISDGGTLTNKLDLAKRHRRSPRMAPVELLASIEKHLSVEVKQMQFDHAALTRRCTKALEKMRDTMEARGSGLNLPPSHYTSKEAPWLEPYILQSAMLGYWQVKDALADGDIEEPEEELLCMPGWMADQVGKFNAAVEGLESFLVDMKKKGVKDLKDEV